MTTWHLKELEELVRSNRDENTLERARLLIRSIVWKLDAARYHRVQAREAFKEFFKDGELDTDRAAHLSFSSSEESQRFSQAILVREVNIVAAAATEHTTPEIIAQLAALLFSPQPIDVHGISFKNVIPKLPEGSLKDKLNEIHSSPEYAYLTAFSNTIKHVSLVIPEFHVSFVEPEFHGVEFKEFTFKGVSYSRKRDVNFINELKTLSDSFIEAGALINEAICPKVSQAQALKGPASEPQT